MQVIKALWPFFWLRERDVKARFLGVFLIILLSTMLTIVVPLIFKEVIDNLKFFEPRNDQLIFVIVAAYGFLWTVSRVLVTLRQVLMFKVMEKAVLQLSVHIFNHLHSLSFDFHVKRKTGEISSAIEKAQTSFPAVIWPLCFLIIPTFFEVVTISILLTYLYGLLFGFFMVLTVIIFLIFSFKAINWSLISQKKSNEEHYAAHNNIVDSFINFSTIKLFNSQKYEHGKCLKLLNRRKNAQIEALMDGRYVCLGQDIIIGLTLILFSLISAHKVLYEGYGISDFVLINTYILQFSIPLGSLGFILGDFHKQLTQMEKVVELLTHKPVIEDGKDFLLIKDFQMTVQGKNIFFAYDAQRPIIRNISFNISPGKKIAFVGPTGSGKSTVTNLLLRFYEHEQGEIYINGQDLCSLKMTSFLKYVGVVPQDIPLFNASLRYNLTYGNHAISDEKLDEVISLTLLNHLIEDLPEGLETTVGERGLAISAGEKQKVGIARALLKNPLLYIFDEATSSLDLETENKIMENIKYKTKNAAVLIIAHRLSTIKDVDEILVFNNGEVVESGTHDSLLKKEGLYANLCSKQSE